MDKGKEIKKRNKREINKVKTRRIKRVRGIKREGKRGRGSDSRW